MKFAKELDDHAIPEWKDKYFDYKGGKKKLKALEKAMRNANKSSPVARRTPFGNANSLRDAPVYSFLNRATPFPNVDGAQDDNGLHPLRTRSHGDTPQSHGAPEAASTPRALPVAPANERSPLRTQPGETAAPRLMRYGSIIGSPPSGNSPLPDLTPQKTQASLLELPDPALDPSRNKVSQDQSAPSDLDGTLDERPVSPGSQVPPPLQSRNSEVAKRQLAQTAQAYGVGRKIEARPSAIFKRSSYSMAKRAASVPDAARPPFLRRVLSIAGPSPLQRSSSSAQPKEADIALQAYRQVDFKKAEFFAFLDKQFDKIEDFHKAKEEESIQRLEVLRQQLHVLRVRRLEEIAAAEHKRKHAKQHAVNGVLSFAQDNVPFSNRHSYDGEARGPDPDQGAIQPQTEGNHHHRWASVTSQVDNALDKIRTGHVGKTSKAMEELGTPSNPRLNPEHRDYERRPNKEAIPTYRSAKNRLKIAIQEYYRGLELLKSYALLNRTAFRKINKKFDKAVNASSGATLRYMSDKVDKAHFVTSDVIDGHIQAIEDLYARYFERGNRKVAIGKLRGKPLKLGDYTGSLFRAGLFLGSGVVLGIEGLVHGIDDLLDTQGLFQTKSSYLLQIYAGYFLFLFLVGIFCADARILSRAKVNYQFVFEFDPRHRLDWRQLTEIPAVFTFLLGLAMFLNFAVRAGGQAMYIYWPVVLIGISMILMLLPPPLFYWNSRKWFWYSLWRLFLAGLYPVEFRDFFLGDMFCSETYAMGNIELFFCLYAGHWNSPPSCNSSNSRLLGFFSTVPGILRALQCLRRYADTKAAFPHLANCGKYTCTILMYMSLSLFRIHRTVPLKGFFICASSVNSLYCIFWDIFMDWSLGDSGSKHPLLRDNLAFKRHIWWYYVAMIVDPILRCNWIFYVIFADDLQHSSIISFAVALSEVCRRGMWTLFRIENEHCTNVSRNRVVRDVELPYQHPADAEMFETPLDGGPSRSEATRTSTRDEESAMESGHTTATERQRRPATASSSAAFLRQRKQVTGQSDSPVTQALKRVGTTIATAHAQDYERKRQPVVHEEQESDDDEDDEETAAAEAIVDRTR